MEVTMGGIFVIFYIIPLIISLNVVHFAINSKETILRDSIIFHQLVPWVPWINILYMFLLLVTALDYNMISIEFEGDSDE